MVAETITVVIENAGSNYSAFSPDVPGCCATGKTVDKTLTSYREALNFHLEGLGDDGYVLPRPKTLEQHIADGLLHPDNIAVEYFITAMRVSVPARAVAPAAEVAVAA